MSEPKCLPITDPERFEYALSEDGCLIYDTFRAQVHFLNLPAYFVLLSCDGMTGRTTMADALQNAFGLTAMPLAEVDACLLTLRKLGLLDGQDTAHPINCTTKKVMTTDKDPN